MILSPIAVGKIQKKVVHTMTMLKEAIELFEKLDQKKKLNYLSRLSALADRRPPSPEPPGTAVQTTE